MFIELTQFQDYHYKEYVYWRVCEMEIGIDALVVNSNATLFNILDSYLISLCRYASFPEGKELFN